MSQSPVVIHDQDGLVEAINIPAVKIPEIVYYDRMTVVYGTLHNVNTNDIPILHPTR